MSHIEFYQEKIADYRNGDSSAFDQIWEKIKALVVKQICGIVPNISVRSVLFEELLQNSSLAVWRSVESFDSDKNRNFTTFCMQSVRNAILTNISSEYRYVEKHGYLVNGDQTQEEADINLMEQIDMSGKIWGWIPGAESKTIFNEISTTLSKNLTGASFCIFILKRLGHADKFIRKQLNYRPKEYEKRLNILRFRAKYILNEAGYNL